MSDKIKYSWKMSRQELAHLFFRLAHALESGADTVDGHALPLVPNGEYKVRFCLETEALMDVRLTAKAVGAGIAANAGDPPATVASADFSAAKRIMQTAFKAVSGSLNRGKLPTPESMEDYLSSSLAMCEGQSDPAYAVFAELCAHLRTAYEAADLAVVTSLVQEMILAKKECHKRLA